VIKAAMGAVDTENTFHSGNSFSGARCMQLKSSVLLFLAESILLCYAPTAGAISLLPMEEPVTQLKSPGAGVPSFQMNTVGGTWASTIVTKEPLLCANTGAPTNASVTINPVYYTNGQTRPWIFGASSASPSTPAIWSGARSLVYSNSVSFQADSLGSLVCYGVSTSGVRRVTRDLCLDEMEGVNYNSTVVLSVTHLPTSSTDYYGYKVDVTIPALAGNPDYFALVEGFDSSVFATTTAESASGLAGGWCPSVNGTGCYLSSYQPGNINYSYSKGVQNSLPTSDTDVTYTFLVRRYLRSGVSLPLPSTPLAMAALFSPTDLQENKLDDNVSVGLNSLANAAPNVVTSGDAWSVFSSKMASLTEATPSGSLSFDVFDTDTAGALNATVTLNLNGLQVPANPVCTSYGGSHTSDAHCSLSFDLSDKDWWNSAVGTAYQGLGNTFATDPGGVSASAKIIVTDALGKPSTPVTVALHVASTVNNPPAVTFDAVTMAPTPDPNQGGTSYPTYSCSLTGDGCNVGNFYLINVAGAITALPGPAAAFDELVSQTTNAGSVQCGQLSENGIAFGHVPVVSLVSGSQSSFNVKFQLADAPVPGSSLCKVTFTDAAASYPSGQLPAATTQYFRIVVNS